MITPRSRQSKVDSRQSKSIVESRVHARGAEGGRKGSGTGPAALLNTTALCDLASYAISMIAACGGILLRREDPK